MADSHAKNHDYHLVDPSPWPIIGVDRCADHGHRRGALDACRQDLGCFLAVPASASAIVLYTMFIWWRDVVKEATQGDHTPVVQLHLRYGMILFIASEVMFFVAWFWAFFEATLFTDAAIQATPRGTDARACGRRPASRCSIPGTCRCSTR